MLHLRDLAQCKFAPLQKYNGEIIVLMCEQKPYPDICEKVLNTALGKKDNNFLF